MKKLLYMLMFVLILSSVSASVNESFLLIWYSFDSEDISNYVMENKVDGSQMNGTLVNTPSLGKSGVLGDSVYFEVGNTEYIDIQDDATLDIQDKDFSISFWYLGNDTAVDQNIFYFQDADGDDSSYYMKLNDDTDSKVYFSTREGANYCQHLTDANTGINDGSWHHIVFGRNGTDCGLDMFLYIDGVKKASTANPDNDGLSVDSIDKAYFGVNADINKPIDAKIDLLGFWKEYALSSSEIELLYNSSNGMDYPFTATGGGAGAQGTLTINHNLQNTSTNVSTGLYLTYNGTVADTGNIFNCTLYNDTNIIETQLDKDLSLNQSFFIDTNEKEENYWFRIYCLQAGEVNDTTTTHFYQIDSVIPSLAFTSNFVNNSNQIKDSTLSISYTFTDTNIYAVNISWFNSDNSLQQNFFIDSLTGSSYSNTTSKLLSDTCTNCSIRFEAWDSHTGEVLKYDLQIIDDYTFRYNNIFITSDKKLKFDKEKDKYSFIVDKKSTICYTTDNYFRKIQSNYNSHYIDFENEIWIDELEYDFTEYYENGKLNKLCFYNDKDEEYKTKSIGDLNYAQYGYNYNVISQDTLYLSQISTSLQNIEGGINMIYLTFIWLVFTVGGIYLLLKGWKTGGTLVYFSGFILDLIIMGKVYIDFNSNVSNSSVGFLFSIALTLLIPAWLLTRTWLGLTITNIDS